jgi:glutamine amidotransferase
MAVAIIKYNAGNIESVRNALGRLGVAPVLTDDPSELRAADRVIFPGVGEASSAMRHLREKGLDRVVGTLRRPVLGICLGMQLLGAHSDENDTDALGVFGFRVRRFEADGLKVPHIGWNNIFGLRGRLFEGVPEGAFVYFVHGFYAECVFETAARCDYGGPFSAAVERGNFFATQFHPEKSGAVGERILANFLAIGSAEIG